MGMSQLLEKADTFFRGFSVFDIAKETSCLVIRKILNSLLEAYFFLHLGKGSAAKRPFNLVTTCSCILVL